MYVEIIPRDAATTGHQTDESASSGDASSRQRRDTAAVRRGPQRVHQSKAARALPAEPQVAESEVG